MNGQALTAAREPEILRIAESLEEEGFTGITGDPQSGKTTLMSRAVFLLEQQERVSVVRIDLIGAYSVPKLVARWRHALLRALVGPVVASHAAGLPSEMWPASTGGALLRAREFLGSDYEAALSESPAHRGAKGDVARMLELTVRLARGGRRCVLILDHIQAPLLTYRHPIVLDRLLWEIRAAAQHEPQLNVAVVCDTGAEELAAGPKAAFFQDGQWLTIPPPTVGQWLQMAGGQLDPALVHRGRGHVPTILRLIARAEMLPDRSAFEVFRGLAADQGEHAARCLQHAGSLHRLGGHVLMSIANGDGPYAGTPEARSDDIATAVTQLRLAGLIVRAADDERGWRLADPLVQQLLADPSAAQDRWTLPPFMVIEEPWQA